MSRIRKLADTSAWDRLMTELADMNTDRLETALRDSQGNARIGAAAQAAIDESGFRQEWDAVYDAAHSDEEAVTRFMELVRSVQNSHAVA